MEACREVFENVNDSCGKYLMPSPQLLSMGAFILVEIRSPGSNITKISLNHMVYADDFSQ